MGAIIWVGALGMPGAYSECCWPQAHPEGEPLIIEPPQFPEAQPDAIISPSPPHEHELHPPQPQP